MRARKACDRCRLRKTKCTGDFPCSRCAAEDSVCTFSGRKAPRRSRVISREYVEMVESQLQAVCDGVRRLAEHERLATLTTRRADGSSVSIGELLIELSNKADKIERSYEPDSDDDDADADPDNGSSIMSNSSRRPSEVGSAVLNDHLGRASHQEQTAVQTSPRTKGKLGPEFHQQEIGQSTPMGNGWVSDGMMRPVHIQANSAMLPNGAAAWSMGQIDSQPAFTAPTDPMYSFPSQYHDPAISEESTLGQWAMSWSAPTTGGQH